MTRLRRPILVLAGVAALAALLRCGWQLAADDRFDRAVAAVAGARDLPA